MSRGSQIEVGALAGPASSELLRTNTFRDTTTLGDYIFGGIDT
jgi:hypothetical protein